MMWPEQKLDIVSLQSILFWQCRLWQRIQWLLIIFSSYYFRYKSPSRLVGFRRFFVHSLELILWSTCLVARHRVSIPHLSSSGAFSVARSRTAEKRPPFTTHSVGGTVVSTSLRSRKSCVADVFSIVVSVPLYLAYTNLAPRVPPVLGGPRTMRLSCYALPHWLWSVCTPLPLWLASVCPARGAPGRGAICTRGPRFYSPRTNLFFPNTLVELALGHGHCGEGSECQYD